jgi:hypothetical protein
LSVGLGSGFRLNGFEEEVMKNPVWIFAVAIVVLAAFSPAQPASAEPLTIIAVVGVAAVFSISTIDIVASHYEDNRDQRAQLEDTKRMHAKAETTEQATSSGKREVAARQN